MFNAKHSILLNAGLDYGTNNETSYIIVIASGSSNKHKNHIFEAGRSQLPHRLAFTDPNIQTVKE